MMTRSILLGGTLWIGTMLTGCTAKQALRPVLVQGAMPAETDRLISRLEQVTAEKIGSWQFWSGTVDGYPVVVSKTLKGGANTAAATALGAEHYKPAAIINQGTSGGHDPRLHVYDIVVGTYSLNIGAFKTPHRKPGEGSDPLQWNPMDLMASEGSAGMDPNAQAMRRFAADDRLLAAARQAAHQYSRGQVIEGGIGSSEVWNGELDRIRAMHERYGTEVEEMETASAAQIAGLWHIPFIGIRAVSNNITNGGTYDAKTGEACEDFVYEVVRAYIAANRREQ